MTRLRLAYFGTADPAHHGVPAELLPGQMLPRPPQWVRRVERGDVVAVSATLLQGVYVEPEDRAKSARSSVARWNTSSGSAWPSGCVKFHVLPLRSFTFSVFWR